MRLRSASRERLGVATVLKGGRLELFFFANKKHSDQCASTDGPLYMKWKHLFNSPRPGKTYVGGPLQGAEAHANGITIIMSELLRRAAATNKKM